MRENILVGFTQGQPKYIGCHMFTFIDYKVHNLNIQLIWAAKKKKKFYNPLSTRYFDSFVLMY